MMDKVGGIQVVKNRLNNYVEEAIGGGVFNNWRISVTDLDEMPVSTLRFPSVDVVNENYDRRTPEKGSWAYYDFTIFIHDEIDEETSDKNPESHRVMDDADLVVDYLLLMRGDETEKLTYGIYWIDEIRVVKERSAPRNISTLSVRGRIRAKWLD